ncbi:MAG TPA: hypothetical protein VLK29_11005, partial [Luteimonas sp.]|nr:hypothetical protein [Luteimonas sp.]
MTSYQPGSVAPGARRSRTHARDPLRPDPIRIAGISGTLLLNTGVFLLLLVPMAQPDLLSGTSEPQQTFRWITAPPKPPVPPVELPVVAPRTAPVAPAAVRSPVVPPVAVLADSGAPIIDAVQPVAEDPVAEPATTPMATGTAPATSGARLEYASAPPP